MLYKSQLKIFGDLYVSDEESSFQLKRTSDKAVLFQVRKKEALPAKKKTFNKGRISSCFFILFA